MDYFVNMNLILAAEHMDSTLFFVYSSLISELMDIICLIAIKPFGNYGFSSY